MIADYFTNPLQGAQFRCFWKAIMGITVAYKLVYEDAKAQRDGSTNNGTPTQSHDEINEGNTW